MATGVGIDIGSDSIKIVQAQVSGGKVTITGALKIPRQAGTSDSEPADLPPDAPGGSAESSGDHGGAPFVVPPGLGLELKKAKLRRSGTVGISGREVILKYLNAPPMPREKLKMLLDMEIAGKLTPSKSGGEAPAVTYDWRILNTPGGLTGDLLIMSAVCKNPYLFATSAMLKQAGINAERLTPTCFGLVNAYLKTQEVKPKETVVLVEIGHELLEIAILEEQNLYFARNAPGGGKRVTAALDKILKIGPQRAAAYKHERARLYPEGAQIPSKQELAFQAALKEGADSIAAAVRSSVMFCRTQAKLPKLDYNRIIISGGGARLNGLREYLEKKIGRPVEMLDLSAAVDPRKMDAASARCFDGGGAEMAVALGLAVIDADPKTLHFSLIPERVAKKRVLLRKTAFAAAAGVLLLAGLYPPYQRSSEAAAAAEKEVAAFQEREKSARDLIKAFNKQKEKNRVFAHTVDYYARQTRMGRVYVELYKSIRAATPENVVVSYLGPTVERSSGNVAPGLGSWTAVDEPVREFMLAGQYDTQAYPGQEINKAWETMRAKLLLVPGIAGAELDPTVDVDPAAAKAGTKPLRVNIRLQDPEKPLAANRAGGETPKP